MAKTFLKTHAILLFLAATLLGLMLCRVEGKLCTRKNGECDENLITPKEQKRCSETLYIVMTGCLEDDCHKDCLAKHHNADLDSACVSIEPWVSCECYYNC
ncbi:hypothetical protein M5689_023060 [Euphorbia peplus]|nr:hypothetical protein M5689_023060 [Euphorbia peplus]